MPGWWPDWRGKTCVIVASGPSAKDADLSVCRGRAKVIAINTSWQLCPWADVLYACDCKWWQANPDALAFAGLKITASENCPLPLRKVKVVAGVNAILTEMAGVIGSGSNSGFQAINLAVQWGVKRVVLVGFDMRLDRGSHWHGDHGAGLRNPRAELVATWVKAIDGAAKTLAGLGVDVVNATPGSALRAFRTEDDLVTAMEPCAA